MYENVKCDSDNYAVHCRSTYYEDYYLNRGDEVSSSKHVAQEKKTRSRKRTRKVNPRIVDANRRFVSSFDNDEDWPFPFQWRQENDLNKRSSPSTKQSFRRRHSSLRNVTQMKSKNDSSEENSSVFELVARGNFFEHPSFRNRTSSTHDKRRFSRRILSPGALHDGFAPSSLQQRAQDRRHSIMTVKTSRRYQYMTQSCGALWPDTLALPIL
jgi:hypothetical protein